MRRRLPVSSPLPARLTRALGVAVLSAFALAGCAGPGMGPGGPGGPFGRPGMDRPAPPSLFVSPFGEVFTAGPGEPWPVADWFLGADADLDGVVVFEEFAADGRRWFAHLDADRDGRLGQAELWAYEASIGQFSGGPGGAGGPGDRRPGPGAGPMGGPLGVAPQTGPGGGGPGGPGGDRAGTRTPPGGGGRGPRGPRTYGIVAQAGFFNLPQPVKAADVNIDQRVTREEWLAATQRWFLTLDTDRDGRLTLASLPRTPLQQRAEARR